MFINNNRYYYKTVKWLKISMIFNFVIMAMFAVIMLGLLSMTCFGMAFSHELLSGIVSADKDSIVYGYQAVFGGFFSILNISIVVMLFVLLFGSAVPFTIHMILGIHRAQTLSKDMNINFKDYVFRDIRLHFIMSMILFIIFLALCVDSSFLVMPFVMFFIWQAIDLMLNVVVEYYEKKM